VGVRVYACSCKGVQVGFMLECVKAVLTLDCVAVCCSVLHWVALSYRVLQCVAVCCSMLQYLAVCCSMW